MKNRNLTGFSYFKYSICALIIVISSCTDEKKHRDTKITINPDCNLNETCNKNHIVYINAKSSNDVLHFIIAAGEFMPTLSVGLIRSTDLQSKVKIDWEALSSNDTDKKMNSISLEGNNITSHFGLIFTKVYEFVDTNSDSKIPPTVLHEWPFNAIQWNFTNSTNSYNFTSTESNQFNSHPSLSLNGTKISLEFSYQRDSKQNNLMPKLFYDTNNIQFEFNVNKSPTDSKSTSRFALQFALINGNKNETMDNVITTSFDDESSPGIFQTYNFLGQNKTTDTINKTYVQWKPVCYLSSAERSINTMSTTKTFDPKRLEEEQKISKNIVDVIKSSIVYFILGTNVVGTDASTTLINATFGTNKDKDLSFITWTASFGYGDPPEYKVSTTIILVIIFGLGLPFVLVVVGSIYLVIKKRLNRSKSVPYDTLSESIN